jgi:hypothetical protein
MDLGSHRDDEEINGNIRAINELINELCEVGQSQDPEDRKMANAYARGTRVLSSMSENLIFFNYYEYF